MKAANPPTVDQRIEQDYQAMKSWLPTEATDILDIGCGCPRIDVWLARHYGDEANIHLLDGDEEDPTKKGQGFHKNGTTPWKSRYAAVKWLEQQVPNRVYSYPADPDLTIPCDLIISRRSWGHHYPIATYLALADRSLRLRGRIILDVRTLAERVDVFPSDKFRVLSDKLEVRSFKCKRYVLERHAA